MALYSGYSTIDFKSGSITRGRFPSTNIDGTVKPFDTKLQIDNQGNNTFVLTDIALVERNILNHIFTSKGSRVMMPSFGSVIPELLFEQLNNDMLDRLKAELTNVINYDPRVKLVKLTLVPDYDRNSVNATALLNYIELNVTKDMNFNIQFN